MGPLAVPLCQDSQVFEGGGQPVAQEWRRGHVTDHGHILPCERRGRLSSGECGHCVLTVPWASQPRHLFLPLFSSGPYTRPLGWTAVLRVSVWSRAANFSDPGIPESELSGGVRRETRCVDSPGGRVCVKPQRPQLPTAN